jgi:DNA-binding response OmpR family regulator
VGIPEDHLDLIFKRYHQVEKNKMFYKGGSGIGLAHAKELINIHKGEISVKSNEHEGSEFIITLPRNINSSKSENVVLQTEDVKEVILKPSSEQKIIFSGKKTKEPDESINSINKHSVLVIEDDLDMHNYIVGCLQPHYNVYEAFNGTEGLKQCLKIYPDIIISDIMMDNMDGIELCNKIKTELKVCHIPVILLTALAAIENKIIGFETGADDYITKPFDSKLLLARVENIIQSRMRLREVFSKTINIEPSKITINSLDEEFLNKALKVVEKNISDCSFDVDTLCTQMHVSRSVFYRKIKALTNLASNDFIKSIRLKRSAQLLKDSDLSVSHIANEVGFIDQKYFSKSFRKYFGVSPTEFVKKVTVDE